MSICVVTFLGEQGLQRVAPLSRSASGAPSRAATTAAEENTADGTTNAAPSSGRAQQVVLDGVLILFPPRSHASEAVIYIE